MKGMLLAAGKGTRLHPLTMLKPKPIMPVANISVLEHSLLKLNEYGVNEVGINVSYMAQSIIDEISSITDYNIVWSVEPEPIGTAGGLKKLEGALGDDDTILVISGDAIIDFDLREFIDSHKRNNALVTILAVEVTETDRFGIIVHDKNVVTSFQEKPIQGTELSNLANTSIYCLNRQVFDMIPENTFFDFALDLFPYMLEKNIPIHVVEGKGQWTDIGNPLAYHAVNMEYLDGKVKIPSCGKFTNGSLIGDGTDVSNIELSHSVIGSNCKFQDGSSVINSVVWDDFSLDVPINVKNAIVTNEFIFNVDA